MTNVHKDAGAGLMLGLVVASLQFEMAPEHGLQP